MYAEALVDVGVKGVSTGPVWNGAGPLELHVVQDERGAGKRMRFEACCKSGPGGVQRLAQVQGLQISAAQQTHVLSAPFNILSRAVRGENRNRAKHRPRLR